MHDNRRTKAELIAELKSLRLRTATLEDLIKDQSQLVRELDESEAIYKSICDLCPDAIVILQGDMYRLVNDSFTRTFGYTQHDVEEGLSFYRLVQEHDLDAVRERHKGRMDGKPLPRTYQIDLLAKDGSIRPCETSAALITYKGKPANLVVIRDISERLESERMVKDYEQSLDQLARHVPQVLWITSADMTRVIYLSPAFERVWGRPCKSVLDEPASWFDSVVDEDIDRIRSVFADLDRDDIPDLEYRIRRSDGAVRWILTRGVAIRDADGRVQRYVGISEDITERKSVAERAALLSQVTEQVADAIITTDLKFNITYVNRAFSELYGYSPEEVLGRSPGILNADPNVERVQREIYKKVSAGGVWRGEVENRRKDGSTFPIELVVFPVFDQNGMVKSYAGSQRDITARKAAQDALRESETQYRLLLENMPDGIVLIDQKGDVVFANAAICQMTGRIRDDVLGRSPAEFMPADDWERARAQMAARLEADDRSIRDYNLIHKNGNLIPVEVRGQMILFQGERRLLIVIRDITERKRWEAAVQAHGENLEHLVEERTSRIKELERHRAESDKHVAAGRMAAQIAHEVNNPLAGIKNAFSLIKDAIPPSHQYYEYVGRIDREIERIATIVRQMFSLYRPDEATLGTFQLRQVIDDVITLMAGTCRERNVHIEAADVADISVCTVEGTVVQILFNIVANAVDASPDEGRVLIGASVDGDSATITVKDSGPGIPDHLRERIFEPFFTTKTGGDNPRLGLGLSITRGLAKTLNATVSLQRSGEDGTVFSLRIPCQSKPGGPVD